jgi:hypothetical protein
VYIAVIFLALPLIPPFFSVFFFKPSTSTKPERVQRVIVLRLSDLVGTVMTNLEASPISQLLHTLGITREDLEKRSDQMRQFLTTQDLDFDPLRVTSPEISMDSSSGADIRLTSMASTSAASSSRSRSRANSYSLRDTTPITPVKSETVESGVPLRHFDSMEMVIERQRRQNRRERKERRERERESMARTSVPQPPSPSPSNASQTGPILHSYMDSRDEQRVLLDEVGDAPEGTIAQVSERV